MPPSAYIVGLDLNGLGVLRSLTGHVQKLVCIDTNKKAPGMRSRYGEKRIFSTLTGPNFVKELLASAAEETLPPVLFLTQEATVLTVSEHREVIQKHFRISLPQHDILLGLMDKDQFHTLAAKFNAPLPKSLSINTPADIEGLNQLRFPCILKPAYKNYSYGNRFKKAYVVRSIEEVENLYREISVVMTEMVVQEWIDGNDSDIYFCLQYRDSGPRALLNFVGRKIRSWPPRVGGTASCTIAEQHIADAIELTDHFFSKAGFVGMGGIEYKLDHITGKLMMIEPTVSRTDMQHEVATLNGFNLPLVQYAIEADQPMPKMKRTPQPVVWREPIIDSWSRQTDPQVIPDLSTYKISDAYWRLSDPGPALQLTDLIDRLKIAIRTCRPA
jgi:D-aspartate ligase